MNMEQSPWLFYGFGYFGIILYVLLGALELGKKIEVLTQYLKDNSLSIIATIVAYNAVALIWMFSDFFSALGMKQGELNGLIVLVAYVSLSLFTKGVRRIASRAEKALDNG